VSEKNRKHSRRGTKVNILVADEGVEIPTELEKNLFNPFVSGSESRTSGTGSGLGLAITRQIVEKHGGKVGMEDNIDGYTKGFFIEI
jgi:signal transduction histidine kinase